ncbi:MULTISPECIES: ribosomal-processing cysteine protease Prp [unclassified Enterococcus]|uniref:ribosomal-processing cysteine protease Prp n=1 Tax=unclassified Enterococcus TaxID=2608891 RepID=UPI001CE03FCE|nr:MULTISPECIES: ribosomal-processing cysteine protease Prp [unclassified Enterococcus]MCA5012418.1 ribosomal-processing cysteine protease Prp [Enterococcus sp. S23]MCA5015669.1 ribosomal-processing cysteine protease Prp [Enterococcus sp. S22(2020)]
MIKSSFKRNDAGQIISFEVTGHAESGPYGSDIVCAAVSALTISTVNGIDALAGFEPIVETNEAEGGYLYVEMSSKANQEQTNIAQILLENLLLGLQAVEQENLEFIQVKTINKK